MFKKKFQRGQAMVEYAIIGGAIILTFILTASLLQPLLSSSMENTRLGLNAETLSD